MGDSASVQTIVRGLAQITILLNPQYKPTRRIEVHSAKGVFSSSMWLRAASGFGRIRAMESQKVEKEPHEGVRYRTPRKQDLRAVEGLAAGHERL